MTSAAITTLKRRKLRFRSLDEVVADAEQLCAMETVGLGNWSLGQALKHLGLAMETCIDGKPFHVPLRIRIIGRTVLRPVMLYYVFPSGFKLPKRAAAILVPQSEVSPQEGLAQLKRGIQCMAATPQRVAHPVIGKLNARQWNLFHLRHAELHLGYIVPVST